MPASVGSIFAGYRLLGRMFPTRPLSELTDQSYEQLCQKYRSRDFWGNWLGSLFYCFMVAVYFVIMLVVGRWLSSGVPKEHYVGPLEFLYLVSAFFLSLCSSGFLLFCLLRIVLGKEEYDFYLAYGGEKIRRSAIGVAIHFGKAFTLFFWLFMPPLTLLMVAYLDHYASFTPDNMLLNSFWSLGTRVTRPYSDVAGVYEVRKVHLRDKDEVEPYHVIVFTDGSRWVTDHRSGGPKLQSQRELIAFVAQKSGKQITLVDFDENIPKK